MGCGRSKVDDQPLVILCRNRKELIKTASHNRSALAVAHLAYFQSLSDVGEALQRFVDEEAVVDSSPDSPVITLPSDEGKPRKHKTSISSTSISHSVIEEEGESEEDSDDSHLNLSSGSDDHIHITSSSEQEQNRSTETFSPGYASPGYPPGYPYPVGGWGFTNENQNTYRGIYFMKKSAPQSQPFTFQPEIHRVEPSDSGLGNSGYFPGFSGYLPLRDYSSGIHRKSPTPASPSPPTVSTWDFLNVFDTYDYTNARSRTYYPPGMASISSSPDSKEVREREGIPELEEETEHEVIKQEYKRPKRTSLEKVKEHREETPRPISMAERDTESSFNSDTMSSFSGSEFHYVSSSSSGHGQSSGEVKEEYRKKKGVSFELEETSSSSSDISSLTSLSVYGTRELREVAKEIKSEFDSAFSYGKEVAVLLEVSKLPYEHKNKGGFKVILSKIMYLVAPSIHSSYSQPELSIHLTSKTLKMAKTYNEQDNGDFCGKLSSILEKLYVWENKLYKEVKREEKLRDMYEENCKKLQKMDNHGAEASKIDATRTYITKLLNKLDISIKSVDNIFNRIHKLRDEELQPQLIKLIKGLIRMWRSMLKCHQKQFQAIKESKVRSVLTGSKAILDLEIEIREWCSNFNNYVKTLKSYVKSLNCWLSRFLEPEATEDGFGGRIGAPPIFIICKDWQEVMSRVSGENVSNAMGGFASSLHELWKKQEEERNQRVKTEFENQDFEFDKRSLVSSGVSVLDDLKVDLDSMRKKLAEEKKETIKLVKTASSSNLKTGLVPIFDALRKFTTEVVKVHENVRVQYLHTSS